MSGTGNDTRIGGTSTNSGVVGPDTNDSGEVSIDELLKQFDELNQEQARLNSETFERDVGGTFGSGTLEQITQDINNDGGMPQLPLGLPETEPPPLPFDMRLYVDRLRVDLHTEDDTPLNESCTNNQTNQVAIFGLGRDEKPGEVVWGNGTEKLLGVMFKEYLLEGQGTLTDKQIRGLGGIPERCSVSVEYLPSVKNDIMSLSLDLTNRHKYGEVRSEGGVAITMIGDDPSGAFNNIQIVLYRERNRGPVIFREYTTTNKILNGDLPRPDGLGYCNIVKQVDTARSLGIEKMRNISSRGDNMYNGYYTWARSGGNAPLRDKVVAVEPQDQQDFLGRLDRFRGDNLDEVTEETLDRVLAKFTELDRQELRKTLKQLAGKDDLDVQELMRTAEGRAFWSVYGFGLALEFDLRDNSKTMQTLVGFTVPSSCFVLRDRT